MAVKKTVILMAAYNGQTAITEQLNTILMQNHAAFDVVISVDVSSDLTFSICSDYAKRYNNIKLLPYGERFGGAGKNFYRLLKDADIASYDYVAFSDQDDVWPNNKLSRAVDLLEYYDCYSANVTAFWQNGSSMLIDKAQAQRDWDHLFEAAGPGCTYVFKREVAIAFKSWLLGNYEKIGQDVELHDWLLYAFARSRGYSWFIDPLPMMFYRQHASNQVGTNKGLLAAKKRLKLIKQKWYRGQIVKIVEHLDLQSAAVFKYGLNAGYVGNLYLLCHVGKLRRKFSDRVLLALVLLFNVF